MARYIGAILLAAVFLWTDNALRACALVLWEEDREVATGRKPEEIRRWVIHGAWEMRGECEGTLARKWQKRRDFVRSTGGYLSVDDSRPGFLSFSYKRGDLGVTAHALRFLCLPDTMDPRGPEGAR